MEPLPAILPLVLLLVGAGVLAVILAAVARWIHPSRAGDVARMPYESGMDPIHDTRRRFDVRFHLLAIAFLIFDVELLFLYPWAVAFGGSGQQAEVRGRGPEEAAALQKSELIHPHSVFHSTISYSSISRRFVFFNVMAFAALLALGFLYDWRKGVFSWR